MAVQCYHTEYYEKKKICLRSVLKNVREERTCCLDIIKNI